jgi:hypothetical protein
VWLHSPEPGASPTTTTTLFFKSTVLAPRQVPLHFTFALLVEEAMQPHKRRRNTKRLPPIRQILGSTVWSTASDQPPVSQPLPGLTEICLCSSTAVENLGSPLLESVCSVAQLQTCQGDFTQSSVSGPASWPGFRRHPYTGEAVPPQNRFPVYGLSPMQRAGEKDRMCDNDGDAHANAAALFERVRWRILCPALLFR